MNLLENKTISSAAAVTTLSTTLVDKKKIEIREHLVGKHYSIQTLTKTQSHS